MAATAKKTVFLIEDELDIMYIYKTALKQAGIEVHGAASGKEALEKITAMQAQTLALPALILLDLILPDVNGLELLYALRKHPATQNIPIFILSNYTSEALHNISYIKPDKILLKASTSPSQLVQLVKEALKI